jgi:hypothetical protein
MQLDSINYFSRHRGIKPAFPDVDTLVQGTVSTCKVEGKPSRVECLDRSCPDCGVNLTRDIINDQLKDHVNDPTKWNHWEYHEYEANNKDKRGKKMQLIGHNGTMADLIEEMHTDLEPMARHCFNAAWQHKQIKQLVQNLPHNHCIMMMDFAENYACRVDAEIQSAHWTTDQVTLHPVFIYAKPLGPLVGLYKISIIFITDDLKHDNTAVKCFTMKALEYLKQDEYLQPIHVVHQVTDGCAGQYKSKNAFLDISYGMEDCNVQLIRNFYGTSHGKGPCDGLGATVKSAARRAVLHHRTIIRNALELYEFCTDTENLEEVGSNTSRSRHDSSKLSKRVFLLVPPKELENLRETSKKASYPVKGTLKLHCVVAAKHGKPGEILARQLSCCCSACCALNYDECAEVATVGKMEKHVLLSASDNEDNEDMIMDADEHDEDMITDADGNIYMI